MRRLWSKKELIILRDKYPYLGARGLSKLVHHSPNTIKGKAYKLGIKWTNRYLQGYRPFRLPKTELAYIAGIIDGEGYIGICKRKERGRVPTYSPRIGITNTNEQLIQYLINTFSKHHVVCRYQQRLRNPKHHIAYNIEIRNLRDCLALARAIQPYLIVKQDKAKQLISWCGLRISAFTGSSYRVEELSLLKEVVNR